MTSLHGSAASLPVIDVAPLVSASVGAEKADVAMLTEESLAVTFSGSPAGETALPRRVTLRCAPSCG
jgi:hypothetical protein